MGTSLSWRYRAILRSIPAFGRNRYANIAVFFLGLAVATAACGGGLPTEEGVKRELYGNFETAVASDRNYDVYWLGRSFEAGGLTYEGPEANARAGSEGLGAGIGLNDADALQMSYLPACNSCQGLDITLYSRQAKGRFEWSPLPGREKKTVYVNGQEAVLWTRYDSPGKVSSQRLVVDYGKTVVTVVTGSALPTIVSTPQPEPNPLMDEATFLAAMQNLRPYPQ